jgi:hypothetical protein
MLVRFTKAATATAQDALSCVLPDGRTTSHPLPRQGVLSHEAIRFVVETALAIRDGVFARVAEGDSFAGALAGLDETPPTAALTPAIQAEVLVGELEREQWSGGSELTAFGKNYARAARARGVAPRPLTREELVRLRQALREFGAAWRPLAPGASLERTFAP